MKQKRKTVLLALGWYVHEIDVGVARYAKEHDWILDDISCHSGKLPSWKIDGIITLFADPTQKKLIHFVKKSHVPVVALSDQVPEIKVHHVLPDNDAIGRTAAKEFLSRGFENFAFMVLDNTAPVVKERMKGFRDTVAAAGMSFTSIDYTGCWTKIDAHDRFLKWLASEIKKLPKPLAMMAQYDAEANYIVRACMDAGIHIPMEVAVIGVDNDPIYSELGPIPLSSVVSNREQLGYEGAAMLDQLMQGKKVKSPIRIPPSGIILRQSSDVFAAKDPAIAKALNYIVYHLAEPFTLDDLAKESGVSRRGLYNKFNSYLGHSLHQEIIRQRLAKARQMLQATDEKFSTIAEVCGFKDGMGLSKVFRLYERTTPSDIRMGKDAKG
ncbi:MAG: DNA-binding transcriptional regulator [bacterium]